LTGFADGFGSTFELPLVFFAAEVERTSVFSFADFDAFVVAAVPCGWVPAEVFLAAGF